MITVRGRCGAIGAFVELSIRLSNTSGLVLATDVAALDPEIAVGADADEDAGIGHDGRIVSGGPLVEGFEQRLDFAKPRVDLVRQFVGAGVGLLQSVELGAQRVAGRLLVLA